MQSPSWQCEEGKDEIGLAPDLFAHIFAIYLQIQKKLTEFKEYNYISVHFCMLI